MEKDIFIFLRRGTTALYRLPYMHSYPHTSTPDIKIREILSKKKISHGTVPSGSVAFR